MHLAVAIRADAALFIPISPSLTQCTQTMDTLKRVFSHRRSKDTGTHPVPTKRYCRYPACGQPFYTTDPIKEFCSSECLQDFNWRPPPQYFRDVPGNTRSRRDTFQFPRLTVILVEAQTVVMLARLPRKRRIVPKVTRRGRRNWLRNPYLNHHLTNSSLRRPAVGRDPDPAIARLQEALAIVATRIAITPLRFDLRPQAETTSLDRAPRAPYICMRNNLPWITDWSSTSAA
ncbi:hypothetical protein ACG7TL_006539 [Trametes sanguinea]